MRIWYSNPIMHFIVSLLGNALDQQDNLDISILKLEKNLFVIDCLPTS